jgi:hypothetical protein
MDARDALADVAALGPFFAVSTEPADGPEWRPLVDLYTDPEPLRARIAHVRDVLGTDDRVAASIAFQGLAARILSAPLAAVAVHGVVPLLTAQALRFRAGDEAAWRLRCPEFAAVPVSDPAAAAAALADLLLDGHLAPLAAAVRAQVRVSMRLLWGNVASSVAAGSRLVGQRRPGAARRAAAVAEHLLAMGPLGGSGELIPARPPDREWTFRRHSCCLYYRVPGGRLCGDCALDNVPATRRGPIPRPAGPVRTTDESGGPLRAMRDDERC